MNVEKTNVVDQSQQPLMRNRKFLYLWLASMVSSMTVSMYLLAEEWYVVQALDLRASLGIVMMVTSIPRVLFMALGGVVADRMSRSRIMFVSEFSRGLLIAAMIGLLVIGNLDIVWLTLFALFFGVLDAFFWPASQSLLPSIVSKDQLMRANSVMQTTQQVSFLLGPVISGFVIANLSYEGVFGLCAILLLTGSLFVIKVKDQPEQSDEQGESIWIEMMGGFHYVKQTSYLMILLFAAAIVNFLFSGPIMLGIPLMVKEMLHQGAVELSFLQSSFAGGALLGSVMIGVINFRRKRGLLVVGALCTFGIWLGLLSQVSQLWQGILLLLVSGICSSMTNLPLISLVQENSDPAKIGRVMSLISMTSMGLLPLSFGFYSLILSLHIPLTIIWLYSGLLLLAVSGFFFLKSKPVRILD
ncbi:MFS transporter [Melghirimyces algeriensis]|uniref:Major Facilitator Superfamily protein n=1 Tax=Melghirimyces algeriensis TaxID=910412 RepID=A0A521FET6_9BACL|nr:MFS transporter [Melghirimyces algeriensis]SMO94615.1 Major Facilitator Superfamily protein [Melghirimyces algeriensis]